MTLGRQRNLGRISIFLWLLSYATAGLLVHAPYGHVHHAGSAHDHHEHGFASAVAEHAHGHHVHHEHPATAGHSHSSEHESSDNSSPASPVHDDDCAGCKLLGSVSTTPPVVVLELAGELQIAAPAAVDTVYVAEVVGIALARAPPVAV